MIGVNAADIAHMHERWKAERPTLKEQGYALPANPAHNVPTLTLCVPGRSTAPVTPLGCLLNGSRWRIAGMPLAGVNVTSNPVTDVARALLRDGFPPMSGFALLDSAERVLFQDSIENALKLKQADKGQAVVE
jgi:hypothetical protein